MTEVSISRDDFDFLCRLADRGIYAHMHCAFTVEGIIKTSNRLKKIKEEMSNE